MFRSFVWHNTVHYICIALCCIYLTYVKLTESNLQEQISQLNKKFILLLK